MCLRTGFRGGHWWHEQPSDVRHLADRLTGRSAARSAGNAELRRGQPAGRQPARTACLTARPLSGWLRRSAPSSPGASTRPRSEISNRYDAFANASAASPGQLVSIPPPVSTSANRNSVMYRVELNNFTAPPITPSASRAPAPERSPGRHQQRLSDRQSGARALVTTSAPTAPGEIAEHAGGSANYDFGLANCFALYAVIKEPTGSSAPELRATWLRVAFPSVLVDTGVLPRFLRDARSITLAPVFRWALAR